MEKILFNQKSRTPISVAMATYNGETFIGEQIDSIIKQFNANDELVISYDVSTDKTLDIITNYSNKYPFIKIVKNQKKGVMNNFENAIINCKNDIIFLADQDDVWVDGKVDIVLGYFEKYQADAVAHQAIYVDSELNELNQFSDNKKQHYVKSSSILLKNYVQGSCLAFKKSFNDKILPFPSKIPMHDSWIGLIVSKFGKIMLVEDKLLLYRQHANNVTSRGHKIRDIGKMFSDRFHLLKEFNKRKREIRKNGK